MCVVWCLRQNFVDRTNLLSAKQPDKVKNAQAVPGKNTLLAQVPIAEGPPAPNLLLQASVLQLAFGSAWIEGHSLGH